MTEANLQTGADKANKNPSFWSLRRAGFASFMLCLIVLFVVLGTWQMLRLAEKEQAMARIEDRIGGAPIQLPPLAEWVGFDAEAFDYRPLAATGTFSHADTVLVFTSLGDARGPYSGPGYWVVAPFQLQSGGTVFVNRGFVPQDMSAGFADGGAGPTGLVEITGIGRASEPGNAFTPGPDVQNRIEWIRNTDRLSAFIAAEPENVAPIYIDLPASEPGALPQGGETTLTLSNRHFGYALTWFGLALLTPIMLLFWWRRDAGG